MHAKELAQERLTGAVECEEKSRSVNSCLKPLGARRMYWIPRKNKILTKLISERNGFIHRKVCSEVHHIFCPILFANVTDAVLIMKSV